jgi:hypothetical protein
MACLLRSCEEGGAHGSFRAAAHRQLPGSCPHLEGHGMVTAAPQDVAHLWEQRQQLLRHLRSQQEAGALAGLRRQQAAGALAGLRRQQEAGALAGLRSQQEAGALAGLRRQQEAGALGGLRRHKRRGGARWSSHGGDAWPTPKLCTHLGLHAQQHQPQLETIVQQHLQAGVVASQRLVDPRGGSKSTLGWRAASPQLPGRVPFAGRRPGRRAGLGCQPTSASEPPRLMENCSRG